MGIVIWTQCYIGIVMMLCWYSVALVWCSVNHSMLIGKVWECVF